ncbi:sensor histidine kinase inhibitor, KipI family [Thermomonospora echinospora]|uniref:Sensor histidine kinase inhibitor, KipI family n=1 Tax=Thermomonospora echinospora TaxID=1992 RepID=A0A1H5XY42_9ACTN|nr:5-oxoprolinase subunit PxpB [Thermomonospora echinospora]SEG16588.1 sensor histidine kinase inhibitor, KipI family [Thermomonospora echinospora]
MLVRRAGDAAVLVEVGDLPTAHRLHAAVCGAGFTGILDVVPGERTVLIVADPDRCDLDRLAARLAALELPDGPQDGLVPVEIPVVYDGQDVAEVAGLTGLSAEEVVRRHSSGVYVVAYLGFSPGFGYLTGLDPALHVPRRRTPRTSVPAGSVAIAGPYAAVYPSASPGGWRLLGRTELALWDVRRASPALLRPGARVRFVPVEAA